MTDTIAYIKTDTSISICFEDGVSITVVKDHSNKFNKVVDFVKNKQYDEIRKLCNNEHLFLEHGFVLRDNKLYRNGLEIDNSLTQRIVEMIYEGFDLKPMILFLKNLMTNPSETAIESLYGFLEYGKLPIV